MIISNSILKLVVGGVDNSFNSSGIDNSFNSTLISWIRLKYLRFKLGQVGRSCTKKVENNMVHNVFKNIPDGKEENGMKYKPDITGSRAVVEDQEKFVMESKDMT